MVSQPASKLVVCVGRDLCLTVGCGTEKRQVLALLTGAGSSLSFMAYSSGFAFVVHRCFEYFPFVVLHCTKQ